MATQLLQDFPELSNYSREDLEDLLADPLYFQSTFHSFYRVKALLQAQQELGKANEVVARNNLMLHDELFKLRAETQAVFDEAKALQVKWKDVEREQKEAYSRLSPSFLLMRLRHAATAQDEASEAVASAFVLAPQPADGGGGGEAGVDVDKFVKEFKEMRKVYHKRVIWADRWGSGKVAWRDD
ncbi:hypothetical protein FRB94_010003 [Tulasnella sp. JGI-2019a]|nr:hypothetical protein FRB93_011092 [Tulasnella sp. JGI-2019a]KAG9010727.1 hypothetical protein FRB94_010003 [Tulasnella sp. JGI-2019a]KAG9031728.1 hypothetical protein FRB95_002401 [Tulasnella sp. JGI-2019a]